MKEVKGDYTQGNEDNLEKAVQGLDQFTKNWCMNCKETEEKNDLTFRCGECNFSKKARSIGICLIKEFVMDKTGDMPIDFGAMGSH